MDNARISEIPRVSVVVTVYNVEDYLNKCIESICGQSYHNLEIILIDDGSPDNCGKICDAFSAKDMRVKVVHKKNEGAVSARLDGISIANGYYIMIVDGDDWMDPGYIDELVKNAEDNQADLVVGGFKYEYRDYSKKGEVTIPPGIYDNNDIYFSENVISYGEYFHFGINPSFWNKLFITDRLKQVYVNVPNQLSLGDDFAVTIPYIYSGNKTVILDTKNFYHYIQRDDSMVKKYNPQLLDNVTSLICYLHENSKNTPFWNRISDYYTWLIIQVMKNLVKKEAEWSLVIREIEKIFTIPHVFEYIEKSKKRMGIKYKLFFWALCNKKYRIINVLLLRNRRLTSIC